VFRKIITLSLAVLALAVFAAPPMAALANSPAQIERFPINEDLWNPCAEEWVHLEGTLQLMVRWSLDAAGGRHYTLTVTPQNVSGVGLTTGAEYRFSGVVTESESWTWPSDRAETWTWIDQHRFIATGVSENTVMQELLHVTFNTNGEITAVQYQEEIKCQ
jgi:hypothetical protein